MLFVNKQLDFKLIFCYIFNMKKCYTCEKEYEKSNFKKYCSLDCYKTKSNFELGGSLILNCLYCKQEVLKYKSEIRKNPDKIFCNSQCSANFMHLTYRQPFAKTIVLECHFCNSIFERIQHKTTQGKTGKFFCSAKCSSTYLGTQSKNFERSFMELYIQQKIELNFPYLTLIIGDTKQCNGLQLDLYLPELNFAIEINGPIHYINFFGDEYLKSVQERDQRKETICKNKKLLLQIVKCSGNFKISKAENHWQLEIKPTIVSLLPYCNPLQEENINFKMIKPQNRKLI